MHKHQLSRIVIKGFKSIADCDVELRDLNILIGANGAGKSNFIGFFKLFKQTFTDFDCDNFSRYVNEQGGPDTLLHFGRKKTKQLEGELWFGDRAYVFELKPTTDNKLSVVHSFFSEPTDSDRLEDVIKKWQVYHFQDTSDSADVKRLNPVNDNRYLRPDAGNLAAYLYFLQKHHVSEYTRIEKTIRLVAPFFGSFALRPNPDNTDIIQLEWFESGQDLPFKASHLSDGTLRFICLATLLLQPKEMQPDIIIIDEPELGLHPYAITILASMLKSVSIDKQVIISTQSVDLLSNFSADDVIVVNREDSESTFKRLKEKDLLSWLEDYSLGELWKKNILGGRP